MVEGWLDDNQLASNLLDSFSRYPFIARFVHCHPDICAALHQSLRKRPDVIAEQWRRRERCEAQNDSSKAAVSLVASLADAISYDTVDVSRQELAQFITNATDSTTLSAAQGEPGQDPSKKGLPSDTHIYSVNLYVSLVGPLSAAAIFESDEFSSSSTATVRPFAGEQEGAVTCMGFAVTVVGLPPPYTPPPATDLSADAIRDGDAKLTEVAGWQAKFDPLVGMRAEGVSFVSCCAPDGSLEVPHGDSDVARDTIRVHESPTLMAPHKIRMGEGASAGASVSEFGTKLMGRPSELYGYDRIIGADALAQQGLGDIRLKDIVLQMTVRHFPMRVLALHYLRMCVVEGCYEEVFRMAK